MQSNSAKNLFGDNRALKNIDFFSVFWKKIHVTTLDRNKKISDF